MTGSSAAPATKMIPAMPPAIPTLYHVPYFCSSIPYQAILELGIPRTKLGIETITRETLRSDPSIERYSPRRVAPFLFLPSGETVLEAGAILLYICERFDERGALHSLPGTPGRAKFLQGVFYGFSECYRASDVVLMECLGKNAAERDRRVIEAGKKRFAEVVVAHVVREVKEFYAGERFSAVDAVLSYVLMCAEFCDEGLLENEVVGEYYERLRTRSSFTELYSNPFSCNEKVQGPDPYCGFHASQFIFIGYDDDEICDNLGDETRAVFEIKSGL